MNLTEQFLGDERETVRLELSSLHSLWGGHVIVVEGYGSAIIRLIDQTGTERRYALELVTEARLLIDLCVQADLLAAEIAQRDYLVPDEAMSTITLRKGRKAVSVTIWDNDQLPQGLKTLKAALLALRERVAGLAPEYEGPFN